MDKNHQQTDLSSDRRASLAIEMTTDVAAKSQGSKKDVKGDVEGDNVAVKAHGLGIRHVQIVLLFFACLISYMQRVGMSVAIVAMTNSTTANPDYKDYDWDSPTKSLVLSSFFWGYIITQIPSGYFSKIWNTRKLFSIGLFCAGVSNLLVPAAAEYGGYIAVCACRVATGLFQGCLIPCSHTLLARWIPDSERTRLSSFVYAGCQLGTVFGMPISGVLAASDAGWPSIFYIFGVPSMIWAIIFYFYGSNFPSQDSHITVVEMEYIHSSLGNLHSSQKNAIPWRYIFLTSAVWANVVIHSTHGWGFWVLLTEMPSYMSSILKFDIGKNGVVSALPYLAMYLMSFPFSWSADYAIKKGISKTWTRNVANTVSQTGPALALIALGLYSISDTEMDTVTVVAIMVVAVALNGAFFAGFIVNDMELTPNYAGPLVSFSNCVGSIVGLIGPIICGEILTDMSDVHQWNTIFYISAALYIMGNAIIVIFGRTDIEWWNDPLEVAARQRKNKGSVA